MSMQNSWYIRNGRLIDPVTGRDEISSLYVKNGVICTLPQSIPPDCGVIDAAGLVVVPGFMDIHVHLREPGREAAETIDSGSKAAARGGFTSIVTMPNTDPPADSAEVISIILEKGRKSGFARVLPSGCLTENRQGMEPADIEEIAGAGAVAFTDDGSTVANDAVMEDVMNRCHRLGKAVLDHAMDPAIAGKGVMHEGDKSRQLGLPGIPSAAETRIVERDIRLARKTGCAIHIQHLSTAESAMLIKQAISQGLHISAEATPHHIALTDSDVRTSDTNFKMNPPVRSERDRKAILAAVADGTIKVLATDHAPHTAEDKAQGFVAAPFGVIGLETAVGITYTILVKSGMMSIVEWVRRWTTGPAEVINMPPPCLQPDNQADITILDLNYEWVVNSRDFISKSRNTPFEGRRLTGHAVYTLLGGKMTWSDPKSERHH